MDDMTLLEKLNMLAAAHASGPDDDGHIIAQAVEEIERLRDLLRRADAVSTWETTAEGRSFGDEIDQAINRVT